ncbi:MAG: carboxylesterase family protein [Saprospiraceae bacterium]|nr:carboxylesterase family protein [Saprospiraceae bacterium]
MKNTFILLIAAGLMHSAWAQNAPTHEQAYGYIGSNGNMRVIRPAFLPGQYFIGGVLEAQAAVVRVNRAGQALALRRLDLPGATQSEVTDAVMVNSELFSVAGTCTGCVAASDRKAVFIVLLDPNLNEVAVLLLEPNSSQAHFNNARLAAGGNTLYLAFNDEFFGGSHHLRAYDLNLNPLWASFQNLAFVESPVQLFLQSGELRLCAQEWTANSNIGTRLIRWNASTGAFIGHSAYPAYAIDAAELPDGKIAIASVGDFYPGDQKNKIFVVAPSTGEVQDSTLVGNHGNSRITALNALPNGQLMAALNEAAFFEDTLKLFRLDPADLEGPAAAQFIWGGRGAKERQVYDFLPINQDGSNYLSVGKRSDLSERGMLLAALPASFALQPPAQWNNNICGSELLKAPYQQTYPSVLPMVYEGVVYQQNAVLYNGQTQDLSMDIYAPFDLYSTGQSTQKRPLLMFVHGGGFIGGNEKAFSSLALTFAETGYVTASINYRLGVADGVTDLSQFCNHTEAVFAAMYRAAQDTRRAIQFLYDHADEYHIDRDNIFVLGHSAGAINVLNSGLLDDDELPFNFASQLGPLPAKPPVTAYLSWAGAIASLDMIDTGENTPIMFIHGTCDPLIAYDEGNLICPDLPFGFGSRAIAGRKKELCHDYLLLGIEYGDHGGGGSEVEILFRIIDWLKDQVICGTPTQQCEVIAAANPGNCPQQMMCPDTEPCSEPTSALNMPEAPAVEIFPNPATERVTINFSTDAVVNGNIGIYNIDGQLVRLFAPSRVARFTLDVSDLPAGLYFIELFVAGKMMRHKLIIL